MSESRMARLERRGVVAVGGADAEKLLNDLVTADTSKAGPGRAVYAGLLSPQGKVLFDFIVFRKGDAFLFDVARASVTDLVKRLTFYRLRAQVTIDDVSDARQVLAAWGDGAPEVDGPVAPDPRLAALGWRAIAAADTNVATAGEAEYDAHRIALGVPEGGIDFAFGEPFPHNIDMDQLGGIDFDKGCYVGQEVVSRMEHRGTARRRVVIATGAAPLPSPGTVVVAGQRPIGTLASSIDGNGLALVRLDRAKEAMDAGESFLAGETAIALKLPDWARFGWSGAGGD